MLCKRALRWNWNSLCGLILDCCYRLLRCYEWDVVPRHWHSWPCLVSSGGRHCIISPLSAPSHLTTLVWVKERVSLLSSYQWGISLLSGLTAVALLTVLSQRSLLPSPGVRCQQCAQCWPGMEEAVAGLTPVITWQPPSQHQWRWPVTTHMRHTTWTCFLRLSIFYTLKSKNRTWTELDNVTDFT